MGTMIHISDLHIGRGKEEGERAKLIFRLIAASFPRIPVIVTGDIVNSALEEEFIEARSLFDTLAKTNPVLAVPGNHDYAWKGNVLLSDGWKNWVKYLGSPLGWNRPDTKWLEVNGTTKTDGLGIWEDGSCVYFGIDSGDPKDERISARGFISETLAKALHESLTKYAGKTRIALLHHHPFDDGFFTRLYGADMLLEALKNNCELLLFGHEHNYGIWWGKREIPLIVASHKSTEAISGDCLMVTFIDIENPGTANTKFRHRLEVLGYGNYKAWDEK